MEIRQLSALDSRPESGPMQFGDDWPGVFIRGDNAMGYSMALESIAQRLTENDQHNAILELMTLRGLVDLLKSCRV